MMFKLHSFLLASLLPFALSQRTDSSENGGELLDSVRSVSLDLTGVFNIKAASTGPDDSFADFDGSGRAYPAEHLPTSSTFDYNGIQVILNECLFWRTEFDIFL